MATFTFADRYAEEGLLPSSEQINSRQEPAKRIVADINNDKILDVIIADKNETGIDYGLKDSKMSTLCGVNVKLSKSENLNVDDSFILMKDVV